jgi:hypothetical protein
MLSLPKWVQRIFAESFCPHCDKKKIKTRLRASGVFAQGVREEMSKKTKRMRLSYYFEHRCEVCDKPSRFSGFPTNMHDFIADMIEVSNSPLQDAVVSTEENQMARAKPKPKAEKDGIPVEGISDEEVESFKRMMEETQYFEDLLDKIGITKEERARLKEAYKDDNNESK